MKHSFFSQIGMLERDQVDVGVTSFFATIQRKEIVDFSPTLDYAEYFKMLPSTSIAIYFLEIDSSLNILVETSMDSWDS